jgi:hypothetical protein
LANRQTAVYFPNYIRTRLRVGYGTSGPTTTGATTDLFWRQAPKKQLLRQRSKLKGETQQVPSVSPTTYITKWFIIPGREDCKAHIESLLEP